MPQEFLFVDGRRRRAVGLQDPLPAQSGDDGQLARFGRADR
ncbi:hypothetical protein ABZ078_10690 [Streptomyces sp. NPDC006385]